MGMVEHKLPGKANYHAKARGAEKNEEYNRMLVVNIRPRSGRAHCGKTEISRPTLQTAT